MLAYKLEERGGTLHMVDPAYTSQTCSACGHIDAKTRKGQAVFECVACGHYDHADVNASLNILRRNIGVYGRGGKANSVSQRSVNSKGRLTAQKIPVFQGGEDVNCKTICNIPNDL